ncbi:MAG: acyltransferase, partial [Prevotellaceae bacterium]|nr:acyltransferase [Prevotellaceae bacterium]
MHHVTSIFSIKTTADFEQSCLAVFRFQAAHCNVYKKYIALLGLTPSQVCRVEDIPFLPIPFFKTQKVICGEQKPQIIFTSSGTSGAQPSQHFVADASLYEKSFTTCFSLFYGQAEDYAILALLPSYLERQGSSLVYMVEKLAAQSAQPGNGFYLYNFGELYNCLQRLQQKGKKTLLIGVSYALLDFVEKYPLHFPELIVMETGGMKGKRKELPKQELHRILCKGFGVANIHSEYGMTELLSQAYSKGNGIFYAPPWMQICIRDQRDPFVHVPDGMTGGVNIIDLANVYSCAFIETQDLGKRYADGSFEITGRFAQGDLRGCNLMYG